MEKIQNLKNGIVIEMSKKHMTNLDGQIGFIQM